MLFPTDDDDFDLPSPSGPSAALRNIKDPIHDYIPIHPKLARFIDNKVFQRLRNVKQLGTTSYVWPGAMHTRFEHSLGVAYLGRLFVTHLQRNQPELGLTNRDIECVEIAGLCHDLGHGPWSHVWDGMFMPAAKPGSTWTHEQGSEMMFDYMLKKYEIDIPKEDIQFIKALIAGDPTQCSPDEKPFLFDMIANKRNGLDVDKFDYILRDSYMIGEPTSLPLIRIINSARVCDSQICYNIKDANTIYEICRKRFSLHKMVYNHKSAKAIEYMIIDGLLAAEKHLHIAEKVFDPEEYVYLTDNVMPFIQASRDPELAESQAIFDRIPSRGLYSYVDEKVIDWPMRDVFRRYITVPAIVEAALAHPLRSLASPAGEQLEVKDVIVDFSTMHYGMKEENPLDFVKFYSKRSPNEVRQANRGDYSNLMPQYFSEDLLRIYTKNSKWVYLVQLGYRALLEAMPSQVNVDDTSAYAPPIALSTPPESVAPSTPRASLHSRTTSLSNLSFSAGGGGSGTPFATNSFTTVPPDYAPLSPSRAGLRGKKRKMEGEGEEEEGREERGGERKRGRGGGGQG